MRRALSGYRILGLNHATAGPFGAMILADLGAEVIVVERPEARSDPRAGKQIKGEDVHYMSFNRNKKHLVLDLRRPEGLEVFFDLVRKSDVVYDNFRPGVLEKLGISFETLCQANPQIVWCSLSGFGQTGPYRERPGADYIMQAYSGAMSFTGEPDGPPTRYGIAIADHTAGMFSAIGIMAALLSRTATSEPQRVDIGLLDTQIALLSYLAAYYLADGELPQRIPDSGHPFGVPIQVFPTKDDYIVIMAINNEFFRRLCKVVGKPQLADDSRFVDSRVRLQNKPELIRILKEALVTKTTEEWLEALTEEGVMASPVNTVDKALNDPQVLARNMVVTMQHPVCGEVKVVGNPVKILNSPDVYDPPPTYGQHTHEILSQLLEYADEKIGQLESAKVVWGK